MPQSTRQPEAKGLGQLLQEHRTEAGLWLTCISELYKVLLCVPAPRRTFDHVDKQMGLSLPGTCVPRGHNLQPRSLLGQPFVAESAF